jgi:hypothetical protein
LACEAGFSRLAVISAVGTRRYYRERGFTRGDLYMVKSLHPRRVDATALGAGPAASTAA